MSRKRNTIEVVPSTEDLYNTYLQYFVDETKSIVEGMTPPRISRILTKSIAPSSKLFNVRQKHFPEMSPVYIMSVIEYLNTLPRRSRIEGSDCVFFIKEDGTTNADQARGLVAFYVISDVISSTGTDISTFLPKDIESILGVISTLDVNTYKLQCSRFTYINTMSKELMEIVTVLLPKNSELLHKASRVNVSSTPSRSSRVTPLLFLGTMLALSSMMSIGVMAEETGESGSLATVQGPGTSQAIQNTAGLVAGAAAGSFIQSFAGLLSDGKLVRKNLDSFKDIQAKNARNTVNLVLEDFQEKTGLELGFAFEPVANNIYKADAAKLLANIQVIADQNMDNLDNPSDDFVSSVSEDLRSHFTRFLRNVDPGHNVYLQKSGNHMFVVEKEKVDANNFMDNVVDVLYNTLQTTHKTLKVGKDLLLKNKRINREASGVEASGFSTDVTSQRIRDTNENIRNAENNHLVVAPGDLAQVQDFFQILSMVMGVEETGDNVIFKHVCPIGTTCRPVSFAMANPKLETANRIAQNIMASAASSGENVRGVRAIEIRDVAGRNQESDVSIHPFAYYQELESLRALGYSTRGKDELIDAGVPEQMVDVFVNEVFEYQKLNLLEEGYEIPTFEGLSIVLWNSVYGNNVKEVASFQQMQELFDKIYPASLDMENLMNSANSFLNDPALKDVEFTSGIRDAFRQKLPDLLKPLLVKIFQDAELAPQWIDRLIATIDESPNSSAFPRLLDSKRVAYIMNRNRGLNKVLQHIPFVRAYAMMNSGNGNEEARSIIDKAERIMHGKTLEDNATISQTEIDQIVEILKIPDSGEALNVGLADKHIMDFYNLIGMWQISMIWKLELVILVMFLKRKLIGKNLQKVWFFVMNGISLFKEKVTSGSTPGVNTPAVNTPAVNTQIPSVATVSVPPAVQPVRRKKVSTLTTVNIS